MKSNNSKDQIIKLLQLIQNKDNIEKEEYLIDKISVGEIDLLLNEYAQDTHLLITNHKNHTTFLRVEDRSKLSATIHEFATSLIGDLYKITVESLVFPKCIGIKSLDNEIEYYLINYDIGTVIV